MGAPCPPHGFKQGHEAGAAPRAQREGPPPGDGEGEPRGPQGGLSRRPRAAASVSNSAAFLFSPSFLGDFMTNSQASSSPRQRVAMRQHGPGEDGPDSRRERVRGQAASRKCVRGRLRWRGVKRHPRRSARGWQRTVCEYVLGKTRGGMQRGGAEELLGFRTRGNHCRLRGPTTENVPKQHRNNN